MMMNESTFRNGFRLQGHWNDDDVLFSVGGWGFISLSRFSMKYFNSVFKKKNRGKGFREV